MRNETLDTIKTRRSIRAYLPTQVEQEKLEAIVEAGLYAPNGGGETWHFSVIQDKSIIDRLNDAAKAFASTCGLPWLEDLGKDPNFHGAYHSPVLILVSGDPQSVCAVPDTAAATQNLLLAAESLGVGSCWGYFITQAFYTQEGTALRKELGIPEGYDVYTSVMLGYAAGEKPEAAPRKPGTVTYV